MAKFVPLSRASLLLPYLQFLKRQGVGIQRELECAHLPRQLLEHRTDFVSTRLDWAFLDRVSRSQGIPDLGLHVALEAGLTGMMPVVAERLRRAPTLLWGLETLCAIVRRDCTGINCWLSGHGRSMRLNLSKPFGREVPGHHPSEWRAIGGLVDSVRIFAGPDWVPPEIASRSLEPPPTLAYEVFPNARISVRQPLTWIAVPQQMLSLHPTPGLHLSASDEAASPEPIPDFLDALRMSLEPYLGGTYPRIELAAEIAGTSVRTLQRKLAEAGLSYRTLLDEARFAVAARALVESDATSTDIAYSCGYTDPSNFARAFRRVAGVSPSDYRLQHGCAS